MEISIIFGGKLANCNIFGLHFAKGKYLIHAHFVYNYIYAIVLVTWAITFLQLAELQRTKKSKDGKTTDYGKAGAIAEEVLAAIRTVTSYGGQNKIVEKYLV